MHAVNLISAQIRLDEAGSLERSHCLVTLLPALRLRNFKRAQRIDQLATTCVRMQQQRPDSEHATKLDDNKRGNNWTRNWAQRTNERMAVFMEPHRHFSADK